MQIYRVGCTAPVLSIRKVWIDRTPGRRRREVGSTAPLSQGRLVLSSGGADGLLLSRSYVKEPL